MKLEKSEALKIKYGALRWLRLEQRCMFIATEAGKFSADALGVNDKKIIEVEAKTTFEDFKNDFKKHKHSVYTAKYGPGWDTQWVPTHFYFAVVPDLVEKVKQYLEEDRSERSKDYGIINSEDWTVVKRAKWLHKNPPSNRVKCTVALRMGSELIRFHEAWL